MMPPLEVTIKLEPDLQMFILMCFHLLLVYYKYCTLSIESLSCVFASWKFTDCNIVS